MGEWVPKEEWEAQQAQNRNKNKQKPDFIIPPDLKPIMNMSMHKDYIRDFLTCICHGVKTLYSTSNGIIKLRCTGCGMEYGYSEDHEAFTIDKSKREPEIVQTKPVQAVQATIPICTCRTCHDEISEYQSKSSLEFIGQELCGKCMGKALI